MAAPNAPAVPDTTRQFYIRCRYLNNGAWTVLPAGIKVKLWDHYTVGSDKLLVESVTPPPPAAAAAPAPPPPPPAVPPPPSVDYVYLQISDDLKEPDLYFTFETGKQYIDRNTNTLVADPPLTADPFRYFRLPETIDSREQKDTNSKEGYLKNYTGKGEGTAAAPWTFDLELANIQISMDFLIELQYFNPIQNKWLNLPSGLTVKLWDHDTLSANDLMGESVTVSDQPVYILVKNKPENNPDVFFTIETKKKYVDIVNNTLYDTTVPADVTYFGFPDEISSRDRNDTTGNVGYIGSYTGNGKGTVGDPWRFQLGDIFVYVQLFYYHYTTYQHVSMPKGLNVMVYDRDPVSADDWQALGRIGDDGKVYLPVFTRDETKPDLYFRVLPSATNKYLDSELGVYTAAPLPNTGRRFIQLLDPWRSMDHNDLTGAEGIKKNFSGTEIGSWDNPWQFNYRELFQLVNAHWLPPEVKCGDNATLIVETPEADDGTVVDLVMANSANPNILAVHQPVAAGKASMVWTTQKQEADWATGHPIWVTATAAAGQRSVKSSFLNITRPPNKTETNCIKGGKRKADSWEEKPVGSGTWIMVASKSFKWPCNYDLEFRDGVAIITCRIRLIPQNGLVIPAGTLPVWKNDIETRWNNNHTFKAHRKNCNRGDACNCDLARLCCKHTFRIVCEFVASNEHTEVKVFPGAAPGPRGVDKWWYNDTWWMDLGTPPGPVFAQAVRAHEFGHNIGLYDEYKGGGANGPGIDPNTSVPDGNSIMTSGDNPIIEHFRGGGMQGAETNTWLHSLETLNDDVYGIIT